MGAFGLTLEPKIELTDLDEFAHDGKKLRRGIGVAGRRALPVSGPVCFEDAPAVDKNPRKLGEKLFSIRKFPGRWGQMEKRRLSNRIPAFLCDKNLTFRHVPRNCTSVAVQFSFGHFLHAVSL
jgi:hypothetical protein